VASSGAVESGRVEEVLVEEETVWFVLLPAGWPMVVRIDETNVVGVRSGPRLTTVVKIVEMTGLLLLPPPVEEGAGVELGGTVDD